MSSLDYLWLQNKTTDQGLLVIPVIGEIAAIAQGHQGASLEITLSSGSRRCLQALPVSCQLMIPRNKVTLITVDPLGRMVSEFAIEGTP